MSLQIPNFGQPFCTNAAGLNVDGSAATYDTTATVNCVINGKIVTAGAVTDAAIAGTALAAGEKCLWVVHVNASGTVAETQGPIFKSGTDAQGNASYVSIAPVQSASNPYPAGNKNSAYQSDFLPVLADGLCPIGIIYVNAHSATFTPGTTNMDATGIDSGAIDVCYLPYQTNITTTL